METWLIVLIVVVIVLILLGVGLLCFFKRDSIKEKLKIQGGWTHDEVYREIRRVLTESCRDTKYTVVKVKNIAFREKFDGDFDILVIASGLKNCYKKLEELKTYRNPEYTYYFCIYRYGQWEIELLRV